MSETEDPGLPELCDLCGAVVRDDNELYALVPDSSVTNRADPAHDGTRFLVACTREHLHTLVAQYKARPFTDAELWAGKIGRALGDHPEGLSDEALAQATGLTPAEVELGVLWQNLGALRWHERFGSGEGPDNEQ